MLTLGLHLLTLAIQINRAKDPQKYPTSDFFQFLTQCIIIFAWACLLSCRPALLVCPASYVCRLTIFSDIAAWLAKGQFLRNKSVFGCGQGGR